MFCEDIKLISAGNRNSMKSRKICKSLLTIARVFYIMLMVFEFRDSVGFIEPEVFSLPRGAGFAYRRLARPRELSAFLRGAQLRFCELWAKRPADIVQIEEEMT